MTEFKTIPAGTMLCAQASDIDYYCNFGVFIATTDITAEVVAKGKEHFASAEEDMTWWPTHGDYVKWFIDNHYILPVTGAVNLCVAELSTGFEPVQEEFDEYS